MLADVEGRRHHGVDQPDEQGRGSSSYLLEDSGATRAGHAASRCTTTSRPDVVPDTAVDIGHHDRRARLPADDVPALLAGVAAHARRGHASTCSSSIARARRRAARPGRAPARRRRLPHLHVGHHRPAQGRDEHARQRRVQLRRPTATGCRLDARRRRARRRAAVPHHRAHRGTSTVALLVPMPLVLGLPVRPGDDARPRSSATGRRSRSASITVFIALMNDPLGDAGHARLADQGLQRRRADRAQRRRARSRQRFGAYIHNIYGLTETTSPSHGVPMRQPRPGRSRPRGALSVGVPIFNTVVRIVDEDGKDVPAGEVGEFVTIGPAGRAPATGTSRRRPRTPSRRRAAHRRRRVHGRPTAGSTSSTARRT